TYAPDWGAGLWSKAGACFVMGAMVAALAVGVMAWLDRGGAPLAAHVSMAAAASLTGVMFLESHCASHESLHLLTGHASVVVVYLAVAPVLRGLALRWRSDRAA